MSKCLSTSDAMFCVSIVKRYMCVPEQLKPRETSLRFCGESKSNIRRQVWWSMRPPQNDCEHVTR
jgi:hypothetical protein